MTHCMERRCREAVEAGAMCPCGCTPCVAARRAAYLADPEVIARSAAQSAAKAARAAKRARRSPAQIAAQRAWAMRQRAQREYDASIDGQEAAKDRALNPTRPDDDYRVVDEG